MKKLICLMVLFSLICIPQIDSYAAPSNWNVPWDSSISIKGTTYSGHSSRGIAFDFAKTGTVKLYAPTDGTIAKMVSYRAPSYNTYPSLDYGNYIQMSTNDGYTVIMAHMMSIDSNIVSKGVGGKVQKGEFLGYMGNTGCSTGQHLHFEVIPSVSNLFGYTSNYILSNAIKGSGAIAATTPPSSIHINFDANGGSLNTNGKAHFYADAVNTDRGANQIVVYTNGSSTGTNEYGIEYIVNKYGIITESIYGVGNASIPEGGFVISGHGEAINRLSSNIQVGDYAYYNMWYEDLITIYAPEQGLAAQKWVVNGEKYGDLPIPTKSGYEFAGWFTDVVGGSQITSDSTVNITAEQTLYAHWEVKTYRVNYDVNGGTLDGSTKVYFYADAVDTDRLANQIAVYTNGSSTGTNEHGIEYIVNKYGIITEAIYGIGNAKIPEGGFVISGHGEAINRLSSNIEVGDYAYFNKWYLNKISIYRPEQGIVAQKWVVNGEKYGDLPVPTKKGYEFAGWFINDSQEVTCDTIVTTTEDVTLYAHWTLIEPHTATTITNNLFTIECNNIEDGNMVILSLYKDKKFVKLYNEIYQGEDMPFTVTEEYDEAKVMVWKDLNTLKPITDVEIVK